jgi:hypothetical protein
LRGYLLALLSEYQTQVGQKACEERSVLAAATQTFHDGHGRRVGRVVTENEMQRIQLVSKSSSNIC